LTRKDIAPRRGNSALYSSIRYLGEDTDFDTKLIAWTGEVQPKIRRPWERKPQGSPKKVVTGVANGQLDDITTVHSNGESEQSKQDELPKDVVGLTKADKLQYERQLSSMQQSGGGKKVEFVPVWTLEDADGKSMVKVSESYEQQGRFRKYAEQGMSLPRESLI